MLITLRHPIVRKVLLLATLACAGILVGEIIQRWSAPTAEETLTALGATQTMTRTLTINDVNVTADVWALPTYASAAPLAKSKGKTLTVGRTVFVFEEDTVMPRRGICTYPEDLPAFGLSCDYVIDTGNVRLIEGVHPGSPADVEAALAAAAAPAGWSPVFPGAWQRGDRVLSVQARALDNPASGSRVVFSVQKIKAL